MATELESLLSRDRNAVDAELADILASAPSGTPAARLQEALHYAVFGGGKRLRPILVLSSARACGAPDDHALAPAAAIELIHTYSLVHDDLPAMDDDDLRRGRPTLHRRFDDATAILAGDGLLTLALEILARRPGPPYPAERRAEAVALVADAAGIGGMVGGQQADLDAEGRDVSAEHLEWIHRHKTGALLGASARLGSLVAGAPRDQQEAFARYGEAFGLAFQIVDDLLDRSASAEQLGKTPGKDRRAGKATFPALHGEESSRRKAADLAEEARAALAAVGRLTPELDALAAFAIERMH